MVRDTSGAPIPYAGLFIDGIRRATTDDAGKFALSLARDRSVSLQTRRIGFAPLVLTLAPGGDTTVTPSLTPVAHRLSSTVVTSDRAPSLELHGFYKRMRDRDLGIGGGEFVTPEEIELRHPSRTTQFLDDRHGLLVRRVGKCYVLVRCWVPLGPSGCIMTLYVDGVRLVPPGGLLMGTGWREKVDTNFIVFLDEFITPTSLAGIEIYSRGVRAPPQYQMLNGSSGVILMWTK